jgi:hypothetical protein
MPRDRAPRGSPLEELLGRPGARARHPHSGLPATNRLADLDVRVKSEHELQALFAVDIEGTNLRRFLPYRLEVAIKRDWAPTTCAS